LLFLFVGGYALSTTLSAPVLQAGPDTVRSLAHATARGAVFLYFFVGFLVLVQTVIQTLRRRPLPERGARTVMSTVLACGLLVVAGAVATATSLRALVADVLAKQGQIAESRQQWHAARLLYEDAQQWHPRETVYAINLARVLTALAHHAAGEEWNVREGALRRAQAVLGAAQALMPRNFDHPRNLATLHRTWAALAPEATRAAHTEQAATLYRRAVALAPSNAELRNEWATLYLERREGAQALDLLDQSLAIDDRFAKTWYLRAQAHLALHQPAEALADYDRALAYDPKMLASWSGKALTLAEQGRTDEAIGANQQALGIAPNDLITHRNLALLYQRSGALERARQYAESALALAQGADRDGLEQFIRDLDREGTEGSRDQGFKETRSDQSDSPQILEPSNPSW
jgi:tetratricopeptide (TPR) repeat protein